MSLLLRDVEVRGRCVDVRVDGDRVVAAAPALARTPREETVDGHGGALLPGLVDHHLHLHAIAALEASIDCGPRTVADAAGLATALATAAGDRHGWVRGVGYTEAVAGELDAGGMDRLHAARPVRIQHSSGALWMLNSAAVAFLHLDAGSHPGIERDLRGRPTGRVWRADGWLRARLPPAAPPDLGRVGHRLTDHGVTAVTDATPDLDPAAITAVRSAAGGGTLPQRVHLLGVPLGSTVNDPRVTTGPYKIVLADSDLLPFPDLVDRIRAAHATGRAVAVHCVTRESLLLLLAAIDEAGSRPGDRIEHGSVIPDDTCADLARRGLAVVTQPGFITDRGDDYRREVDPADQPDLYRCASLLDGGVPVALSSDAPYGPLDPWTVLRAAVHRRTPSGAVLGAGECLTPGAALDALLSDPIRPGGPPRRIAAGTRADLVLLHGPLAEAIASDDPVRAVFIDGRPALPG